MSDLISKQAVLTILQQRAHNQRQVGGYPVHFEIAKELDAVRDDVKDLAADSEVQRLREALNDIIDLCYSPTAVEEIAKNALSPKKGETPK